MFESRPANARNSPKTEAGQLQLTPSSAGHSTTTSFSGTSRAPATSANMSQPTCTGWSPVPPKGQCTSNAKVQQFLLHRTAQHKAHFNTTKDEQCHNTRTKQLPGKFLTYFYATPYAVVLGNNHKQFTHVTPNRCAQYCMEEDAFVCRSFDYKVNSEHEQDFNVDILRVL